MPSDINSKPGGDVSSVASSNRADGGVSKTPSADLHELKDKVRDDVTVVTDAVKQGADNAMQKVEDTVAEQTTFVARHVGGIATALQKVGAELENGDQASIGRYATQIGESVRSVADSMEGRDLREIAAMAEDFGRKQPLAFLGVAALAGLAASRFLTASASRPTSGTTPTMPIASDDFRSPEASYVVSRGGQNNG